MCRKSICLFTFILVVGVAAGVTNANIVAYWPFDEGSGSVAYDTVGNNDGQFTGSPTWVSPGQIGNSAIELGPGDDVNCGAGPTPTTEDLTLAWWMVDNWDSYCTIFDKSATSSTRGYNILLRSTSEDSPLRFRIGGWQAYGGWGDECRLPQEAYSDGEWVHIACTYDSATDTATIYVNGELAENGSYNPKVGAASHCDGLNNPDEVLHIGGGEEAFTGIVDDVQIYDRALTDVEVQSIMFGVGGFPKASQPSPADGSLHPETWVSVSWRAGDFAVSHDVYFGDNFDDVNDGTGDTYRGNLDLNTTFYIAGFFGYPYPEGLVNGTTYYWRIDEVNDADPNSPWKGPVWSFMVPPKKAYNPVPADSSPFMNPEGLTLSWTPGFGSKLHFIYFGDDYDTVANATGAPHTALGTYNTGLLELEKTYYWRIDESDGANTYTGDVWSFTTAKEGGGLRGDYYSGMNFENLMVTRTDPQVNFNWGDPGGPDATVGDDSFSCRWTGEVEAAFTETYTFYAAADDGVRLWVDGVQLVDAWIDQGTTEYRGTIDLIAGNTYSIVMEQYENGGGATAYLRWSSASTPKQLIPQAALSPPIKASSPSPNNGATGTKMTPILRWGAGDYAASHEVYFGTDADAVANADKNSPEYKGVKALGDESYDPGKLAWFTQYFWRIDEVNAVNPDSPWVGNLWNFTTGDFIVVDNFEDYDLDKPIWEYWLDGVGFGVPGTPDFFAGNGTGAAVGDEASPSYMEESIVHSGSKSIPVAYNNNKQGFAKYSETELTLTAPRDWTEEQVQELSIWFRGYPASTGSFVEGPVGTYTMTGSGTDIWDNADEFHFAYKTLTGAGSIVARVDSVENTNGWAKAGVMIRETLDPGSVHVMMVVTPAQGVSFQRRTETDSASAHDTTGEITAPYWVKIERDLAGNFTAYSSANASSWQMQGMPENVQMSANVYIGLAVTSHDPALTCQAVFSNVTTAGNVTGQWTNQDIGIESNDAEHLYITVSNSTGNPAVVIHDDANAAQINTWTEWVIPLSALADQGINLTNVDRIAIGLGTQGNMTIPGGSGKMYIDDIRLYRSREVAE